MRKPSTVTSTVDSQHQERVGARMAGKLVEVMSDSSSRLGRMAAHPIGASCCLALGYMVLCGAYIVFSGKIAAGEALSLDQLHHFELLKGLAFVIITGAAYFGFAVLLLKRIASQQQHLAMLFHGVSDSLFLLEVDSYGGYRFLCVNAAFLTMAGLTREQVDGKWIEDVLPAPSHDRMLDNCRAAIREHTTVRWEDSADYPAGQRVGEVTLTPLPDKPGRPAQLAGVIRDITERRNAEDAVRQLSGHLLRSQDEERLRIGRELHDATGQELAAVAMNLGLVQQRCAGRDVAADNLLADSQAILENCQRELRTLSYRLHPPVLDEVGLAGAVQEYAEGFAERSEIKVTLEVSPDLGRLSADTERALFRVVQESLGNVHRHSGSLTAGIRIAREGAEVILEVADQGHGFEIRRDGTVSKVGVGLTGMRERMRQLGGRLVIESSGRGTTVRAIVPGAKETGEDHADSHC